jgi:hypothetical protein
MTKTHNKDLRHLATVLFWALVVQIAISSSAPAQTRTRSYTVSPSSVEQGKEYELTIRSVACSSNDLLGTDLTAPAGSGIKVDMATGVHDCTMIARIFVDKDAPVDTAVLRIIKQGSVWGLVDLPVRRNLRPEPTPAPAQPPMQPSSQPPTTTTSTHKDLGHESPRVEIFGGYSYARVDTDFGHLNANGWTASVAGNLNKYFGIVGDVSGHYKTILVSASSYTFLAGPRVYGRNRFATTFGHALFGATHTSANFLGISLGGTTAFAAAFGGGVDVNVHRSVAVRAIQADYVLTRFFGSTQNNVRLSVGVVLRLGLH